MGSKHKLYYTFFGPHAIYNPHKLVIHHPLISINQSYFNQSILSFTKCFLLYVHLYSHIQSFHPQTPAPPTVEHKP